MRQHDSRCFDVSITDPSLGIPSCPADDAQESTENSNPERDGWLAYDEEAEFVRQGVIRPTSLDT